MKIQFVSDMHVKPSETVDATERPLPNVGTDILILAGDLAHGLTSSLLWAERQAQALRVPTLWIAGNHEFYGETWPPDLDALRRDIASGTDLRLLECDQVVIGNVRILATTLWTNFQLFGDNQEEKALSATGALLNDYSGAIMRQDGKKLRVRNTQAACFQACAWLDRALSRPWKGKTLVVTHHAPHPKAAHPEYFNFATAGFVSDLRWLIKRHNIDAWISGHTHYNHDFVDLGTRFVSNQRGYQFETLPGESFDPGRVINL